jgi:hypothetical protein|nr:MAG TPA: hypothetical protein [Caudoviricetes sp.]
MRFSTTLNNQKCMEWELNATQGVLIALLYEANAWANEEIIDDKTYYFVSRNLILKELPMFFEKADTVYRNLKVLAEKGIIEYIKHKGMDLIRLTEKGKSWNFIESNSEKSPNFNNNSEKNPSEFGKKSENNSEKNPTYKDTNIQKDINNKNIYSDAVEYLNSKAGTKYKSTSKNTTRHIQARIKEGYTLEDFKTVIDKKCSEWLNTDMEKYLCPETLFGSKFEKYLNQKIIHKNIGIPASTQETKKIKWGE